MQKALIINYHILPLLKVNYRTLKIASVTKTSLLPVITRGRSFISR